MEAILLTEYLKEMIKKINSMSEEEFNKALEDCGINNIKPSEESSYVQALIGVSKSKV